MVEAHHHRSTLKQKNKPFKSKHATKSSLKELAKGRVPRQSPKSTSTSSTAAQNRLNRKNNARQIQANKREAIISATRVFNGVDGAPRIVAVIPLSSDIDVQATVSSLAGSLDVPTDDCPRYGLWKMKAERFKTSLQFLSVPYHDFYSALDACKVADYTLFILSPTVEVDTWGDTLLRALQTQGLPQVVTCVAADPSVDPKSRTGILKSLLSFIQYFVPSQSRVFDVHSPSDRLNAIRAMAEGRPNDVRWRTGRPWVLAEDVSWAEGSLRVTGFVRGAPLSADRLVHLPDFGDFQISQITSAPLPRHTRAGQTGMQVEPTVLAEPNEETADSLVSENDPDDMANEQTWPTEEEMNGAGGEHDASDAIPDAVTGTTPKRVKRIPKGTSEYQAAWIIDEDDHNDEDEENEHPDGDQDMDAEEEEMVDLPGQDEDMDVEDQPSVHFEEPDAEEDAKQLQKWRNREREEQDDLAFPDEIDTPQDVPARTRFQRYRGMKSFRTSPWDPYENLPRDYARIFQFEDFKRTERAVQRRAAEEGGVEPGTRVTVILRDVPSEASVAGAVTTVFGLMQHEHKISVLNFTLQRNTEYNGSVRSKDPLVLCVGPRRMRINPIYSQHTRGGGRGTNNVHKFERYLRHGLTSVATTYGPVTFGNQPCMFLRETADVQAPELVAMGSFMNPDTTRVIAKRIILSGHPFKVHKKTATIRYMFFNPDDIAYFKPIALHTKHGRTGHIRESLGTHGYFKAHFDGPINQMDTVCMSLYKRVFPKMASIWKRPVDSDDMVE